MSFSTFETAIKAAAAEKQITGATVGAVYKTDEGEPVSRVVIL
jgi:hypothetical protein